MSQPGKPSDSRWSLSAKPAAKKAISNVVNKSGPKSTRAKATSKAAARKAAKKADKRAVTTKTMRLRAGAAGSLASRGFSRLYLMPGYAVAGAVRDGILPGELQTLIDRGYSRSGVVRIIGPRSTIERKLKHDVCLDPQESDRLARMVRVIGQAEQVFGNPDKARHWMERPSSRLPGGESPLSLLDTDSGTQAVTERLMQIEHGIFA